MPEKLSAREAGRLGGKTTSDKYGAEFYQEIGRKGGVAKRNAADKIPQDKEALDDGGRQEPT